MKSWRRFLSLKKPNYQEVKNVFLAADIKTPREFKRALNDYLFLDSLCDKLDSIELQDDEPDDKTSNQAITRCGLAKWVTINNRDPEFKNELLSGDMFLLSALESYSRRNQNQQNDKFMWDQLELSWEDAERFNPTESAKDPSDAKKKLYTRWFNFKNKWSEKNAFQGKFLTLGESSFSNTSKCENYLFLNKFIVTNEETAKDKGESKASFSYDEIHPRAFLPFKNLFRAQLMGAQLMEAILMKAILMKAILMEADLGGADLRRADFSGANLTGADLRGADLRGANLMNANLTEAQFEFHQILRTRNWKTARFSEGIMEKLKDMKTK